MTSTSLVQEYLDYLKKSGKSKFTVIAYSGDLKQYEKFLQKQGKTIINVTEDDIRSFAQTLEQSNLSVSSKARKVHAVKSLYRYLLQKGLVSRNPTRDISAPKVELGAPRVLKKVEYMALREASRKDAKLRAMVEVLLQTGIRVGELVRLRLKDLKYTKNKIPYLYIQPFASHDDRTVPLPKAAYEALKAYLDGPRKQIGSQDPDSPMFVSKSGAPLYIRNIRFKFKAF